MLIPAQSFMGQVSFLHHSVLTRAFRGNTFTESVYITHIAVNRNVE